MCVCVRARARTRVCVTTNTVIICIYIYIYIYVCVCVCVCVSELFVCKNSNVFTHRIKYYLSMFNRKRRNSTKEKLLRNCINCSDLFQGMYSEMRTVYIHGLCSRFHEGYSAMSSRHPKECQRENQPKSCEYNNQNKDNSLICVNYGRFYISSLESSLCFTST